MDFVGFMRSTPGRALKVVVGVVLVLLALLDMDAASTFLQVLVLIVGIGFIVLGALNYCLLAPLFGKSIKTGR